MQYLWLICCLFVTMPLLPTCTDNDKFHHFKPDCQNRSLNCALKDSILTTDDVEIIQAYISEHWGCRQSGIKTDPENYIEPHHGQENTEKCI